MSKMSTEKSSDRVSSIKKPGLWSDTAVHGSADVQAELSFSKVKKVTEDQINKLIEADYLRIVIMASSPSTEVEEVCRIFKRDSVPSLESFRYISSRCAHLAKYGYDNPPKNPRNPEARYRKMREQFVIPTCQRFLTELGDMPDIVKEFYTELNRYLPSEKIAEYERAAKSKEVVVTGGLLYPGANVSMLSDNKPESQGNGVSPESNHVEKTSFEGVCGTGAQRLQVAQVLPVLPTDARNQSSQKP